MRIAVNAIFLKDQPEGYGNFVAEIFRRIVANHPDVEFIFVFDRPFDRKFIYGRNVTGIVVGPAARHPLSFRYWYDIKVPLALRKYHVDLWVQPYGFCSLFTRIPQLLVVHDLSFIHFPQFIGTMNRWYYKLFTKKFIRKAKRIVTVSEYSRQDIIKQYGTDPGKIGVVYSAAKEIFEPVSWFTREDIKEARADGKEYFLFTGGVHPRKNLMNLLKAFSLFKKWQKSNMKLLVAGRLAWQYEDLLEKLKTYKYRNDVVLLGYVSDEELASITASAYAMVYPSWFEGFGVPILEAMRCGVPVITSETSAMPETGGEAALYADPASPDSIAKHMLELYKNEDKRARLAEAGFTQAARFSWDSCAGFFWENILEATGK